LLELSGIGQPERLRNLGIEVRHELPGVGENLRDHYVPRTRWLVGKKGITFNDWGRGLGLAHQMLRYALFRQHMMAMGAPIRAFVCSREGLEAPDLAVTSPVMEAICDSASNRNPAGFCYPFDRSQKIIALGQNPDRRRSAPSSEAWIQAHISRQNPCVGVCHSSAGRLSRHGVTCS
jgi:choline dehydrogenase-like flavoprotein